MYKVGDWPTAATKDAGNTNIQAVNTAASAGDTIILNGGAVGGAGISYSGIALDADSGLTISKAFAYFGGCRSTDLDYLTHGGQVTLDANAQAIDCLTVTAAATVSNLRIGNSSTGGNFYSLRTTTVASNISDITFYNSKRAWRNDIADTILSYSNVTHNLVVGDYLFVFTQNTTLSYCDIGPCVYLYSASAGKTITWNNCDVHDCELLSWTNDNDTTIIINNTNGTNLCYKSVNAYPLTATVGSITTNNSNILPNPINVTRLNTGTVTQNDPQCAIPLYRKNRRPAIVIFGSDDTGNLDSGYWALVAGQLERYNWSSTFGFNTGGATTSQYDAAGVLSAAGHEIAAHGRRCGNNIPDMNGITIAYSGGELTAQAIVNAGSTTLTLEAPNGNVVGTFDLTSAARDSLAELVTGISGVAGFTGAKTNTDSSNGWSQYLAPGTYNVKPGPTAIDYDSTLVYAGELDGAMSDLNTGIQATLPSYVCQNMICPGNVTDANLRTAQLAAGYGGSRGVGPADYSSTFSQITEHDPNGTALNIFNIKTIGISASSIFSACVDSATPTVAEVKQYWGTILQHILNEGGIVFAYAHNVADLTIDGWINVLSVTSLSGVMVKTLQEAVLWIKANCTDSGDHLTYTKDMTDTSIYYYDKRILPYSIGVRNGTPVAGLTIDYYGNTLHNPPNIGLDDTQAWGGGLSPGLGLSGGNRPPAWRRRR